MRNHSLSPFNFFLVSVRFARTFHRLFKRSRDCTLKSKACGAWAWTWVGQSFNRFPCGLRRSWWPVCLFSKCQRRDSECFLRIQKCSLFSLIIVVIGIRTQWLHIMQQKSGTAKFRNIRLKHVVAFHRLMCLKIPRLEVSTKRTTIPINPFLWNWISFSRDEFEIPKIASGIRKTFDKRTRDTFFRIETWHTGFTSLKGKIRLMVATLKYQELWESG